jgi:beta-1,4-mannosyltransferase
MLPRSPWWRAGAYLNQLEVGLRRLGVETADDPSDGLSWRWLLRNRGQVDILHLHWLQYHYDRDSTLGSAWAWLKFTSKVLLARLLGYGIVWTLHNLEPHEQHHPRLDWACRLVVAWLAHRVIVHCQKARDQLRLTFGRQQGVAIVPLGNDLSFYPKMPEREAARQRFGFAEGDLVFLCFGAVRPYKGFQDAIVAFKRLPNPIARLVIVGRPINEQIAQEIRTLALGDARIQTVLELVPGDDLLAHIVAADVALLPYRKILTSAATMTAMSLGRPVIAPKLGCLPELVTEDSGILYDPANPEALLEAMRHCWEVDLVAMGQRAYEAVTPLTWLDSARKTRDLYMSIKCPK